MGRVTNAWRHTPTAAVGLSPSEVHDVDLEPFPRESVEELGSVRRRYVGYEDDSSRSVHVDASLTQMA
jgi:hypothetical protein